MDKEENVHSHIVADESQREEVINRNSTDHNQQTDRCYEIGY